MRWQKEKDPLSPGRSCEGRGVFSPLPFFGVLALVFTVVSFFLGDAEGGTGDMSRAVSYFEDFFTENEAIAVFLGWEGN